ncbi:MAG: hypothetical protein J6F30_07095, partial [Cellulosilyticum sp.]|nr:hypothetical protein [Cellulosilyticum sp.]
CKDTHDKDVQREDIQCKNAQNKEVQYINVQNKEEQIKVILGFTPKHIIEYELEEYKEDDATLFILGESFKEQFDKEQLRVPIMSHT